MSGPGAGRRKRALLGWGERRAEAVGLRRGGRPVPGAGACRGPAAGRRGGPRPPGAAAGGGVRRLSAEPGACRGRARKAAAEARRGSVEPPGARLLSSSSAVVGPCAPALGRSDFRARDGWFLCLFSPVDSTAVNDLFKLIDFLLTGI